MRAYYNEIDPYAAQWLRNLVSAGHIAPGDVDERSIVDVCPDDVRGYTQCHWFAGIGGWSSALRLARWPDERPTWTGSCPCQPFSTAGARRGFADERHLWPFWFHLIQVCRPPVVFGEQVANGSGPWLDLVLADLEGADYAVGAAVLPAAGVGAPHIRDRVWFVAQSDRQGQHGLPVDAEVAAVPQPVANSTSELRNGCGNLGERWRPEFANGGSDVSDRFSERAQIPIAGQQSAIEMPERAGWWDVEPRLGRVVDGFPTRAQRLRCYGNAIVPQVAAAFIASCKEI